MPGRAVKAVQKAVAEHTQPAILRNRGVIAEAYSGPIVLGTSRGSTPRDFRAI